MNMYPEQALGLVCLVSGAYIFVLILSRSYRLDIFDLFLFSTAIHFFGLGLLDSLLLWVSDSVVLARDKYDSIVIIIALLLVFIAAVFTAVGGRLLLPRRLQLAFGLRELFASTRELHAIATGLICLGILTLITFVRFESSLTEDDPFAARYLVSSIWMLAPVLLFSVVIVLAGRFWAAHGMARFGWLLMSLMAGGLVMTFTRRDIFYALVVFFLPKVINLDTSRILSRLPVAVVVAGTVLLVVGNAYQTYRGAGVDLKRPASAIVVIGAMGNIEATIHNLEIREKPWSFLHSIIARQLSGYDPPYGQITRQAIRNSVPRFLTPDKKVIQLDSLAAEFYDMVVTDYPGSAIAFLIADFGYLTAIPIFVIAILVAAFVTSLLVFFIDAPMIKIFILSRFIYYMLNIESEWTSYFILYRDYALLISVYILILMCRKGYSNLPLGRLLYIRRFKNVE